MFKIRKVKFIDHPILKNLELDFCDRNGNAVDTVIFAGENGTGKSVIINALYQLSSHSVNAPLSVELENNGEIIALTYYFKNYSGTPLMHAKDNQGMDEYINNSIFKSKHPFSGIFSDVDINFHATEISNVTSLTLDAEKGSRRSTDRLPMQINQLLVDIQAQDDADVSLAARQHPNTPLSTLKVKERMPRFTTAFNRMFEALTYSRIENKDGKKSIIFQKNNVDIPISSLSSGEKQVVYRGCFLLKDVNATNGAFVFIDEPEISLHPTWQMKVMDYYKSIFTDESGNQTSQIFAVTHSPFVIHNDTRHNDKVIVLARNESGETIVKDKPEYFKCNSVEAVQDAFSIESFSAEQPTVYLEGRTDEKYFNRALEVYGYKVPFQFKWIGYIDAKGEEAFTGKDSLNKAAPFLISRKLPVKNVLLYDCDANKPTKEINNVITLSIPKFPNDKDIQIGIENALVFGGIDVQPYKEQKKEIDGYGIERLIPDFRKMECCNDICALDTDTLKAVFVNLKSVIDQLISLFEEK